MIPHSPALYLVLHVLFSETSGNMEFLQKRSAIWAEHISLFIRGFPQLFTRPNKSDLISASEIDFAIELGLREHLLFEISEKNSLFIDAFLENCGVEFIWERLENGFISLTPLGVSYVTQIHDEICTERKKIHKTLLPAAIFSDDSSERHPTYYCFVRKYQKNINKSEHWSDQTEFIVGSNKESLKKGFDDNNENCTPFGDDFVVTAWATQWWDVHYKGVACEARPIME